jgi:hypothetical protein
MREGNLVPCQTAMVRAACYREAGLFDSRLRFTPDLEMWLRLAIRWDVAYLSEPLVLLRRHRGQESNKFMRRPAEVSEVWRAFEIALERAGQQLPDAEELRQVALRHVVRWSRGLLRQSLVSGRGDLAVQYAIQLARYSLACRPRLAGGGACVQT